jgi:hemolysin III
MIDPERPQTLGEEIANSVSHGLGLVAAALMAPILIAVAARSGDTAFLIGASVFAASILVMYLSSTLYHALPDGRWKRFFRVLDHGAIFLLIAGTYTAFSLGPLGGPWGWTLFGIVWALAVIGVLLKWRGGHWGPRVSTLFYLVMGWVALIAIKPLYEALPAAGILWLAAGGLAYTSGVAFFAAHRVRYAHFVWHLFVVAGTTCHVMALLACTR